MKNTKIRFSVLIPDGEHYHLISIINCLSQVSGIKIHVMSNIKHTAMRYSRHVNSFSFYPKTSQQTEWISNINKELLRRHIDIIMPIYEEGIVTILKYRDLVSQIQKLVILPSLESYTTANNKGLLSAHIKAHQIPGPTSFYVHQAQFSQFNLDVLEFPVIAKPATNSGGGKGIHVFNNKQEIQKHFAKEKIDRPYVIQDYLNGYDLGCNVLCKDGEILAFTIQKGNIWEEKPFKPQIGLNFLYEQKVYDLVQKLMISLNWSGVANVDMFYDTKDQEFKVLEINPRYWSTLDASLLAGVNFPYLYCLTSLNVDLKTPTYEHLKYANLRALVKSIKKNKRKIFDFAFIWNNTPFKYAIQDPVPIIYKFIWRTKNMLMKPSRD